MVTSDPRQFLLFLLAAFLFASPVRTPASAQPVDEIVRGWEEFGVSVAGLGDLNGDGYPDLAVGAPLYTRRDHSKSSRSEEEARAANNPTGGVFVLSGRDGEVIHLFRGAQDSSGFGISVGYAGDVNMDGVGDVLVGEPWFAEKVGRVWIFSGKNGGILGHLETADPVRSFGRALGHGGDVNGDGVLDIAVGGPDDGQLWIYSGKDLSLLHHFRKDTKPFGGSVDMSDDFNGDGCADIIAGAPNGGEDGQGLAWILSGASGETLFRVAGLDRREHIGLAVCAPGDLDGDDFPDFVLAGERLVRGFSGKDASPLFRLSGVFRAFTALGDVDGDNRAEFVAGAPGGNVLTVRRSGEPIPGGNTGAVFIFSLKGHKALVLHRAGWKVLLGQSSNLPWHFGTSVSKIGDLDKDGVMDFAVGAPDGAMFPGGVRIFSGKMCGVSLSITADEVMARYERREREDWTRIMLGESMAAQDGKKIGREFDYILLNGRDPGMTARIETQKHYKPPFKLKVQAMTDYFDLRLYYGAGMLRFNPATRPVMNTPSFLTVIDPASGEEILVPEMGFLPENAWHQIIWEIDLGRMCLVVDGRERFQKEGDYAALDAPLGIGACEKSEVSVKSFVIEDVN